MTINEMIAATVAAAGPYGAYREYESNVGTVGVSLDLRQSRTFTANARADHFSKNFTLNGRRISRKNLENLMAVEF